MYYYRSRSGSTPYDYSGFFRRMPRVIRALLVINGLIFFLQLLFHILLRVSALDFLIDLLPAFFQEHLFLFGHKSLLTEFLFGLVPTFVIRHLWIWQPVTYMFLHGGFGHILFNMFTLWMFGSDMERYWGTSKFLKYYFITGVGAALLTVAFTPTSGNPTIGASGALYGILLAFGLTFPNRPIYIYFIIPVKAKHLVLFFALLEFYFSWTYTGDGIAHLAHFGGMLIGYLYIKRVWRVRAIFSELKWKLKRRKFKVMDDGKDFYH
ncbi:MAG: rhomboid family intramembrane serine protease [Acidobacteriota bacterium]